MTFKEKIIGPRIPDDLSQEEKEKFLRPTFLLAIAGFCLLISIFLPYWSLTLHAPQYPDGLKIVAYLNQVTGDVHEIDELNHYIGMRKMEDAAQLERSLSIVMIIVISLLTISAIFIHNQWAALLSLPALVYPLVFLGDLYFWLWNFGTHLDPKAPLSTSVKPFVPPVLGTGHVGQFKTVATWDVGLWLAILASILIALGLYYHRKAYKPLVERIKINQN